MQRWIEGRWQTNLNPGLKNANIFRKELRFTVVKKIINCYKNEYCGLVYGEIL